jgi:hypothetical protein
MLEIEPMTFQIVALWLNKLCYRILQWHSFSQEMVHNSDHKSDMEDIKYIQNFDEKTSWKWLIENQQKKMEY